jgi:hypothetical protein
MEMPSGVRERNTTVSKINCLFTKRKGKCEIALSRSEKTTDTYKMVKFNYCCELLIVTSPSACILSIKFKFCQC